MNNGAKNATSEAARWHKVFTRTERELKALVHKFPPLPIHDRCDFACPGVAIFNGSEIQRCDDCKRFPSDDEAIRFVQLTLQAHALGVKVVIGPRPPPPLTKKGETHGPQLHEAPLRAVPAQGGTRQLR